jgi:hypothetical protein
MKEMKEGLDKLKRAWNENPMAVIGVGALAITSVAKLIDATSAAQGRRAYAKQVNHLVKQKNQK